MLNHIHPSLPNEWASALIKHVRAANINIFAILSKLFERKFVFFSQILYIETFYSYSIKFCFLVYTIILLIIRYYYKKF